MQNILQLLSRNTAQQTIPPIQQLRQMVGAMKSMTNPQAMLNSMIQQNNPALSQAMDYIKQHGGDAKAACEALAKEKGINLHDLGL